jgi:hypothetical protein
MHHIGIRLRIFAPSHSNDGLRFYYDAKCWISLGQPRLIAGLNEAAIAEKFPLSKLIK